MLTGRTRYRTGWRGRQILQVQYEQDGYGHWRDATEHDHGHLSALAAHRQVGVPYIPQPGFNPSTGKCDFRGGRGYGSGYQPEGRNLPLPPPPPPRPPLREVSETGRKG